MRKVISIFLLSLLLLQAIPVLHFFSAQKEIFYVYIDEEKPGDAKELKEGKEYLAVADNAGSFCQGEKTYPPFFLNRHSSPLLENLTPPPDPC